MIHFAFEHTTTEFFLTCPKKSKKVKEIQNWAKRATKLEIDKSGSVDVY